MPKKSKPRKKIECNFERKLNEFIQMKKTIIDQPFQVSEEAIAFFQKHRFIKLKNVLDAESLAYYGEAISRKVAEINTQDKPMEQRDTYGKAFLQIFNLWREDETCKEFVSK